MPRLLDQHGNIISFVHYDETEDRTYIGQRQDCEAIIEHNKRLQTMNDGYSPSRELRRVASIPLVLFERWLQDDGLTWYAYGRMGRREQAAYRAKKLLSSDWRHLRTAS